MKELADVVQYGKDIMADRDQTLLTRWDEISYLFRPSMASFVTTRTEGDGDREKDTFDALPIDAAERLAQNLMAWMANPATQWMRFEWSEKALKEDQPAKEWLEEATKLTRKNLNISNWNHVALEGLMDLVTFGTECTQIDEIDKRYEKDSDVFRGFNFRTHHMKRAYGAEGPDGNLRDTVVVFEYTARQAAEKYGEENLPKEVQKALKNNKTDKFEFVNIICWRTLEEEPEQALLPDELRPYWNVHYEKESGEVVRNVGLYDNQRVMARYATTSDSRYGYSPAMKARSSARVLSTAQERDLDAWDAAIDPPVQVNPQMMVTGEVNRKAKGITQVEDINRAIGEMPGETRYTVQAVNIDRIEAVIKRIMLYDDLELPDRERVGQMTAYEIQKRIEHILRKAGSVVTRVSDEFFEPLLLAAFYIQLRRGVFPEMPETVKEFAGQNVLKVEFLGPLAKAQKSQEADAVAAAVQEVVGMAQIKPDVIDNFDIDSIARDQAMVRGVPADKIRDEADVKKVRDQRDKLIAAQAASGANNGNAGTAPPLAAVGGN